jgi:hypothetical protein
MTQTHRASRALVIALASAFALPILPVLTGSTSVAEAGGVRVRVGGSVHVRVGGRVHVRRRYRRYHRPRRVYYYGGFYTYRFAQPPPPRYNECEPVPSCNTYSPTYTSSAPVVATTVRHRDPLPRFGLGVTAGRFETDDGRDADDLGIFARFRLTDALEIELESMKTDHDDGTRLDKRLGGALYLDFSPYSTWAPYLVGGAGVQSSEGDNGAWESDRTYGEIGGGLRWRLNDSFTLAGDLRVGVSEAQEDDDYVALTTVLPGIEEQEQYTRFSLKGILYF